jgi:hypothetical protein
LAEWVKSFLVLHSSGEKWSTVSVELNDWME